MTSNLPGRVCLSIVVGAAVVVGGQCSWGQTDDHGDGRSTATRIDYGIAQTGSIDSLFDVDVFRVDLHGRARVQFRSTMALDTLGRLYDSEGLFITSHDDIDLAAGNVNFLITAELDRGIYYLEVEGYDLGDYGVLARFDLIGDDHGDTFGSSTIVPLGPRVAGNVNDRADVDWFRLDFPVRTYADVYTVSQKDVVTALYHPRGGDDVSPNPNNRTLGTRNFRWFGDWEGTYYLAVSGAVSAYNVRVEADDTGCSVATVQPVRFEVPVDAPLVSTPLTGVSGAADVP